MPIKKIIRGIDNQLITTYLLLLPFCLSNKVRSRNAFGSPLLNEIKSMEEIVLNTGSTSVVKVSNPLPGNVKICRQIRSIPIFTAVNYFITWFMIFVFIATSCVNEDIDRPVECDGSLFISTVIRINPGSCLDKGVITLNVTGGVPPYQFSRNGLPRQSTGTFTSLPSGSHSITVFDFKECQSDTTIFIDSPPASDLSLTITSITGDNSCSTDNGSVTLGWSGTNNSPFLYSFNNSAFTSTLTYNNLAPGNYEAIVQDANGCTDTKIVTILQESTNIKWSTQVKDILKAKCVGCHPGSGSSDNWGSYAEVFAKKQSIRARVEARTMPPSSSSLSDGDRALILCWIDDGAQEN